MTTETESTPESRFIESLARLSSGPRAELRRSLLQDDPSLHPPIFRYVEPYAPNDPRKRKAYYLVAALFGMAEKDLGSEERRPRISIAKAIRRYSLKSEQQGEDLSPMEKRFLALLDSDEDELPHRLRQMVRMLTSGQERIAQPLDWAALLKDLKRWNFDSRSAQTDWAKEYYKTHKDTTTEEETDERTT